LLLSVQDFQDGQWLHQMRSVALVQHTALLLQNQSFEVLLM
jgi:hypothetical protein